MVKAVAAMMAGLGLLMATALPAAAIQTGRTTFLPEDYIVGAWWLYKSAFVEGGRVIDRSNGNVSHSEGQGYGMLIAVAANDRETFEAIWNWTRKALYVRGDALAAWKWDPQAMPNVADRNNASDGDLLIAWALSRAATKWNEPAFADEAHKIVEDLTKKVIVRDAAHGTLLLPAEKGFSGADQAAGPVVNLSYWVFPAIQELGAIDAGFPAVELTATGQALLKTGRFGASSLPADWLSLKNPAPAPAENYAETFGYEAVRIPLYTAWLGAEPAKLLAGVQQTWNRDGTDVMHVMELATAAPLVAMSDPGYRAVSELLSCSLGRTLSSTAMQTFEPTEYYPSTLHLLSIIAISERYPQCLPELN